MTSHPNVTHSPSSFHTLLEQHRWPWHFLNSLSGLLSARVQILRISCCCRSLENIGKCTETSGGRLVLHRPALKARRMYAQGFWATLQQNSCRFLLHIWDHPPPLKKKLFCIIVYQQFSFFPRVNAQVNEVGQVHCKMLLNQPCRIICLDSEVSATAAPCSLIHSNEFCFNCFILSAH